MEEFNMNLDELLNLSTEGNMMSGKLFETADVDVTVHKENYSEEAKEETQMLVNDILPNGEETESKEVKTEERPELTNAEFAELKRKEAMSMLERYEASEKKLSILDDEYNVLTQQLEALIAQVRLDNKELIDAINAKSNEIEATKAEQSKIKEDLLPVQREVYLIDNEDKTLKFNKIQSTYVAPTEKNKFDLKQFREKEPEFWKENFDILKPYAEITTVSDYLKITISKK